MAGSLHTLLTLAPHTLMTDGIWLPTIKNFQPIDVDRHANQTLSPAKHVPELYLDVFLTWVRKMGFTSGESAPTGCSRHHNCCAT